jgi:hypothetical protein
MRLEVSMHTQTDHITLTDACKIAPGRPSTNCMWRWCRRGVIARSGQRVKLQHIRIGGKLYTTAHWVSEFGQRLAEADARYFDREEAAEAELNRAAAPEGRVRRARATSSHEDLHEIERVLDEAGL